MFSRGYTAIKQIDSSQDPECAEGGLDSTTPSQSRRYLKLLRAIISSTFTYISVCVSLVAVAGFVFSKTVFPRQSRVSRQLLPQEAFFPHFSSVSMTFVNGGGFTRNDSYGDKLWDELVPKGAGYLRVPNPRQYDLPPSEPLEVQDEAYAEMYQASVVHQLHCMAMLRDYLRSYENGIVPPNQKRLHVVHCIEYVRQAILCTADTTLEQANDKGDFNAEGAIHQCRDWNAVKSFLEERRVDDDIPSILIT